MEKRDSNRLLTACAAVLLILFLLAAGCAGAPKEIPEDLDPEELFQRAQEAVVKYQDYKTALRYYEVFLERYPQDTQNRVVAKYEIGFIYYKMEKFDLGETYLKEVLTEYEGENARNLPAWPRVLSEKILAKIDERKEKKTAS